MNGKNVRVREGQWHYRFNLGGVEYSGATGLEGTKRNRKAAERFAVSERRRLQGEQQRSDVSLTQAAAEFLEWCKDSEYHSKPNTAARLRTSFASIVEFMGSANVRQIESAQVEAYKIHRLHEHRVREITVRHDLHALSVFFRKYAVKMGLASDNPVDSVTIPSDRDAVREHVITPKEEAKYFAAAEALHAKYAKSFKKSQPNVGDLARLMLEQGARPEELLAARKEAFDPKGKTLLIEGGKTRAARRTLNLSTASMGILERRANLPSPWLFPSDRNPGHHLTKLACTHDRICLEAGVSFVLYDFRHTFASRQVEAGTPVAVVAAMMGHTGLRTIHRYVHPSADAQKKAMRDYEAKLRRRKMGIAR